LTALLDHSLVVRRIGPDREVRFGMLQTIQEFAVEQLELEGQLTRVQHAHALHFASVAEDMEVRSVGSGRELQLERFRADRDNHQAALRWCLDASELTIASRIVGSLWNSWACGYVAEGRRWADVLLAKLGAAEPTRARARVSTTHLGRSLAGENIKHAEDLLDEALAVFESLGNTQWRSMTFRHRGMIAEAAGDAAAVRSLYSQSLALARESGDSRGIAQILCYVGRLALREGDTRAAQTALQESLDLLRRIGDRRYTSVVLESLARLAQRNHNSRQARGLFAEALDLFREAGDKPGIAAWLVGLDTTGQ
jgi:tetratricopeptide (TPR) repeat protein